MTALAPAKAPRYISLKFFYFCFYGALGAYFPFLQLYYRDIGLDVAQIGLLATVGGLIGLLAGPLWTLIADAFRLQRVMLPLCFALNLGLLFLIGQTPSFGGLVLVVGLNAFLSAPVGPLADSGVVLALGERRELYGAQRLWGSVSWAVSTVVAGALVTQFGVWVIFPIVVGLGVPAVIMSARLPRAPLIQPDLRAGARQLLRDRGWLLFILSAFLLGCCLVAATGYATSFIRDIGGTGEVVGAAFAIGALAEIPVMGLTARIIRRFGARRVLLVACLLYALCAIVQSVLTDPWAVAASQVLRGVSYGLFWTASVISAPAAV